MLLLRRPMPPARQLVVCLLCLLKLLGRLLRPLQPLSLLQRRLMWTSQQSVASSQCSRTQVLTPCSWRHQRMQQLQRMVPQPQFSRSCSRPSLLLTSRRHRQMLQVLLQLPARSSRRQKSCTLLS